MIKKALVFIAIIAILLPVTGCSAPTSGTTQPPASNRLEAIQQRGYIEVATEPYFAPNEFLDPTKTEGKNIVGSDIELAKYIAAELGVELRIVPLEFSAVLAGVTEGKYDLAISALAYTPLREEAMGLSKGYYFSKTSKGHGLLIREENADAIKGPDDVAGKVVVAQSGSLQELFVNQQLSGYSELKRVSSTSDMFLSVQEGKADVGVTAIATAELHIAANPDCGLMVVPDFSFFQDESTLGTRIGMPKDEAELLERINEIIDKLLEEGVYEQWYEEYTEYAKSLGV